MFNTDRIVERCCFDSRGDVLIFLTGQDEIDAAVKMIRSVARDLDHSLPRITVYPLYAALPSHQQLKVFEPAPQVTFIAFVQKSVGKEKGVCACVR